MKRKFYESTKRKAIDDLNTIIKIIKIVVYKRKLYCIDTNCKKQKICNCIVHEEKYICDIYECNVNVDNFMVDTRFQ